ncbi:MAG: hypothetical protein JO187_05560 [Acidobacteria bacterium]|nr:hypothetical protein [Acidobacteriaceae bacterium]MBV9609005.1 hypothetical protein [Acidobacteriota bacterium]
MEAPVRQRQTGQALVLVGALVALFCLVAISFVPSDIRAGHHFWTIVFAIDVILAIALVATGTAIKARTKSRLNV